MLFRAGFGALALCAAPLAAAPADDFRTLLADHWAWWLADNPVGASSIGDRSGDGKLGDLSIAGMERSAAEAAAFRKRLAAIPMDGLEAEDRVSAEVLATLLDREVEGNAFPARALLFTNREGFHTGFAGLPRRSPFFTAADYDSYVRRLEAFPAQMDQAIATTRVAIRNGQTLPCVVLGGLEASVRQVAEPVEKSRFMEPFANRPASITEGEWTALKTRGTRAVTQSVNPAYVRFADFLAKDYVPSCPQAVGVSERPMGRDYYQFRARSETTTKLTPDEIHSIGLSEVARIRAEMETVAKTAGFATRDAYVAHLRSDPRYYAKSPAELLAEASWQAKIADGWMPRLFGVLPRLPYTVKPIPDDIAPGTTTAYYMPGSATAGNAGVYYVNTSKLNERPLFELPALTIHEAVPGHHHQIALQQELDLPLFRRHAAFFTAFTEGWGLYSERLGIEMGMYDTPERDMGRLSYEMWRATRLVVDTGMHWKGWSRDQAIQYMLDNTALSKANIEAEINRYIAWPGQALGYKIGELRIRAMREEAEKTLGSRFDLRSFHDRLLESGSIPLDVLETKMRTWISAEAAR